MKTSYVIKKISPAREGIVKHSKPLTQAQVTVLIV
jgi:hypothetical protein